MDTSPPTPSDDVRALAVEIGPRGTGTRGEAAAADYVARRLEGLGLTVSRRRFRAVRSQNDFPLSVDALTLVGVLLSRVGGRLGRWVGMVLGLAGAPLLWRAIRLSTNPLRPLLPKVTSGNVVSVVRPRADVERRVVVLAHLDTNRCRLAWRSGSVGPLEPLTWLTLGMHGLLGAVMTVETLLGEVRRRPSWPAMRARLGRGTPHESGTQGGWGRRRRPRRWPAALMLPTAYAAGTAATLVRDDRTPFSPGAHDNAASVAVALQLALDLCAHPLERTEVWLAFTGAEETDHAGLYALVRDHDMQLRDAVFMGLEGLGSGDLVYLTQQGLCDHYGPDGETLRTVERAAAARPDLGARPARMVLEDEVGTLRRRGYRALCIAGLDPSTGTLPHWHRADDTADTVSPEFMARAARFVRAVLDEFDRVEEGGW